MFFSVSTSKTRCLWPQSPVCSQLWSGSSSETGRTLDLLTGNSLPPPGHSVPAISPKRADEGPELVYCSSPFSRDWFSIKTEFTLTSYLTWAVIPENVLWEVFLEHWDYAQIPQRTIESGTAASKEPCCSSNASSITNLMTGKVISPSGSLLTIKITKRPKDNSSSKLF